MKNYDSLNLISSLAVDAGSIAVGTQSGKILLFDSKKMELKEAYMAHSRRVTDIWMQHNKAIVSTSHDMKICIKSLTAEFDDQTIDIQGYAEELQCISVIDNMCAPASLNCFVGTMEGRLLLYTRTFFREKVEALHNMPEEGAVTQVKY